MTIRDLFAPFEDELQLLPSPRNPNPPLIEWRAAFGDFFFRVKGMEPEVLWCDLGYTITSKRPLPPARRATLVKRVSRAYAGRTFFRVVPFEDGGDWALVRPKRALVKSPAQTDAAIWQWKSDFAQGQTHLAWLSSDLAWFENWVAQQPSDEREQARAFSRMDAHARQWSPYVGEPRTDEKWKVLVPALQKLVLGPKAEKPTTTWIGARGTTVVLFPEWTYLKARHSGPAQRLFEVLVSTLPLHFQQSNWRGLRPHSAPTFVIEPSSQHERLEAALLWRDFGREIDQSDKVEPLLRKLLGVV